MPKSFLLLAAAMPLALTGCSLQTTASPKSSPGLQLHGSVHGGQQPVAGANVYLMAAATTGYGAASLSLLTSGTAGANAIGGYVLTDAGGSFNISGDYTCTPGQQVYVLAFGGDPGAGANAAAGFMAPVGACPAAGNFAATVPFIEVNEISTVAFAYATAGFAVDPLHIASSGTALAATGLANAFANTANLTNGPTTPAGNGTVPVANINTLADILATCVNSDGAVTNPSPCYTLFTNAPQGSTIPSDTAAAILNIAHNPTQNVGALYNLLPAIAPFQPTLTATPLDFNLALTFTGGGLATSVAETAQTAATVNNIAVDAAGNIWKPNYDANTLTALSPLGVPLAAGGFSGGGLSSPHNLAIDLNGSIWTANDGSNTVSAFSSAGLPLSGSPFGSGVISAPANLAIDSANNVWIATAATLVELSNSGVNASGSPFATNSLSVPQGIAIQPGGNVWVSNAASNTIAAYTSAGAATGASPFTSGGLAYPYGIAFDSFSNGWIAEDDAITQLSSTGVNTANSPFASPSGTVPTSLAVDGAGNVWTTDPSQNVILEAGSTGLYISISESPLTMPEAVAIDGSGNVWYSSLNDATIHELVGAATPVVTPLAYGVQNSLLGTRP